MARPAPVRYLQCVLARAVMPRSTPRQTSTVVQPAGGWSGLGLRDLWRARDLLYWFAWRDLKIRYKQTVIGAAWVILQPLLIMTVFTIFFGKVVGVSADGLPYPVFVYAGLLPWNYFNLAMGESANSLVSYASLVTKIYFPRLAIPVAPAISSLVDLGISSVIFLGLMLIYGIMPPWQVIFLPFFMVLLVAVSLTTGIWLSALNLRYRDVRHVIPFATQLLFFVTPVIYPSTLLTGPWKAVYTLNPLAVVVDGVRWSVLDQPAPHPVPALISVTATVLLLLGGIAYFRHAEQSFADVA